MNMMEFSIKGFKCFFEQTIALNKLTLLTGANASGKSSVIQAFLILKAASESSNAHSLINLADSRLAFDFGNADTLINNEINDDKVSIALNNEFAVNFDGSHQQKTRALSVDIDNLDRLRAFFSKGLTYFTAERQGPRFEYALTSDSENSCGCRGENTGNVMSDNWNTKISGDRLLFPSEEKALFNIALDDWVNFIFPGVSVRVQPAGTQNYQIIIRERYHNLSTNSTNIGFGISYALPILVGSLLANEGSWLVIENPEAHLHAKAQSNIGFFLGIMAAAGLRVVIETHSEHLVNGARKAAIVSGRLHSDDVNIYFFKGKSESELISVDKKGNLSDFPVDFFDQSRQDMLEIISKTRGDGNR